MAHIATWFASLDTRQNPYDAVIGQQAEAVQVNADQIDERKTEVERLQAIYAGYQKNHTELLAKLFTQPTAENLSQLDIVEITRRLRIIGEAVAAVSLKDGLSTLMNRLIILDGDVAENEQSLKEMEQELAGLETTIAASEKDLRAREENLFAVMEIRFKMDGRRSTCHTDSK